MAGSGQVAIAAEILGRRWIAMDCSANYCWLIEQRLEWFKQRAASELRIAS
jgi:DNA modification methylase